MKAPPTHRSVKIIIIAIMPSISPKIQILGTKLFLGEMLFIIEGSFEDKIEKNN
jgi:hypothetical protein